MLKHPNTSMICTFQKGTIKHCLLNCFFEIYLSVTDKSYAYHLHKMNILTKESYTFLKCQNASAENLKKISVRIIQLYNLKTTFYRNTICKLLNCGFMGLYIGNDLYTNNCDSSLMNRNFSDCNTHSISVIIQTVINLQFIVKLISHFTSYTIYICNFCLCIV